MLGTKMIPLQEKDVNQEEIDYYEKQKPFRKTDEEWDQAYKDEEDVEDIEDVEDEDDWKLKDETIKERISIANEIDSLYERIESGYPSNNRVAELDQESPILR